MFDEFCDSKRAGGRFESKPQASRNFAPNVFFFLGLAAAATLAAPATVLTVTGADAQTQGMERRDERRQDRQDRRTERRTKKKKKKATQ